MQVPQGATKISNVDVLNVVIILKADTRKDSISGGNRDGRGGEEDERLRQMCCLAPGLTEKPTLPAYIAKTVVSVVVMVLVAVVMMKK